jgi:hypothetical protein
MPKLVEPSVSVHPLETLGQTSTRDQSVLSQLEELVKEKGHPLRHVLALWPCYIQRVNLTRFLAHYELFKHIIDLPGCVVEIGVGRGSSFFTWSRLMEIFCPNDRQRRVYGFDWFEGLKNFTGQDGRQTESSHYVEGGWSTAAAADEVRRLVSIVNEDNIISKSVRCQLIEGDVEETIPRFLEENPGLRIALLHLDADMYKPTKAALKHLYPRVLRGGVVVFDEYGMIPWQGETNAADEYFLKTGENVVMKKFPWSLNPHGYFIKQSGPTGGTGSEGS